MNSLPLTAQWCERFSLAGQNHLPLCRSAPLSRASPVEGVPLRSIAINTELLKLLSEGIEAFPVRVGELHLADSVGFTRPEVIDVEFVSVGDDSRVDTQPTPVPVEIVDVSNRELAIRKAHECMESRGFRLGGSGFLTARRLRPRWRARGLRGPDSYDYEQGDAEQYYCPSVRGTTPRPGRLGGCTRLALGRRLIRTTTMGTRLGRRAEGAAAIGAGGEGHRSPAVVGAGLASLSPLVVHFLSRPGANDQARGVGSRAGSGGDRRR